MPDDVPQMDGGMMDEPMDGFDPGVEANEDEDPKKFIQQLTGKLSQSLRSYNSQLPRPDADLCKYVAGMVMKQAVDGLSEDDVQTIIDRTLDDEADDGGMGDDIPAEGQQGEMPQGDAQQQPQQQGFDGMEGKSRKGHIEMVNELFRDIIGNQDDDDIPKQVKDVGYRKKPYTSPNFS